jgi:hypothetical protein
MLGMFCDLVGIGMQRPLCDAFSVVVWWKAEVCTVRYKNFMPHHEPENAALEPQYGDYHRGKPFCPERWALRAKRADNLTLTLYGVGIQVCQGNVVHRVEPKSMAAEAGVVPGWFVVSIGGFSVDGASHGSVEQAFASATMPTVANPSGIDTQPKTVEVVCASSADTHQNADTAQAWRAPWHDALPAWPLHSRMPAREQQAEFFLPLDCFNEGMKVAQEVLSKWSVGPRGSGPGQQPSSWQSINETGIHIITEIRCIRGTEGLLTLAPVDCFAIHLTLNADPVVLPEIMRELRKLEEPLARLGAWPHWGKLHTAEIWASRLGPLYGERLQKFRKLMQSHDPSRKFRNDWLDATLFVE